MSRLQPIADKLIGLDINKEDPEEMMLEILEALNDSKVILPEEGGFYTFVYLPKTPNIEYDEFPLIACMELKPWGIKGFNYHWGKMRNYTWAEVVGEFHELEAGAELEQARSFGYAKFKLNT